MSKETRRKLLTFTGGFALGVCAIKLSSLCLADCFADFALRREKEDRRFYTKGFVSRVNLDDEVKKKIVEAADKLRESCNREVKIIAHDGEVLTGHLKECKNAKRIIIAMHGWRSDWATDFGAISDFWHLQGCEVLYAEQRGQNGSGGKYMGFGMTERYDCADWVRYINIRTGGTLPIYLAGLSMGGATVLMASDLTLPKNVKGIIADSAYTSPYKIWKYVAENNLHLPYAMLSKGADMGCLRRINMHTNDFSAPEALSATDIPVLIIHGSEDHFVPVTMAYDNYKSCNSPKHLLIVPGADHCMSYFTEKKRYEKAVLDFWADYDCELENFEFECKLY